MLSAPLNCSSASVSQEQQAYPLSKSESLLFVDSKDQVCRTIIIAGKIILNFTSYLSWLTSSPFKYQAHIDRLS